MSLTIGTNTYQSLDAAASYATAGLGGAVWAAATGEAREAALREAYQALEHISRWDGMPYSSSQLTQWPRKDVYTRDGALYPAGDASDPASYPQPLKDAQVEEALARLRLTADPGVAAAELDRAKGIHERRSSEGAGVTYVESPRYIGGLYSERAYLLIRPLLRLSFGGVLGL